jgi:hypothetical protein
MRTSHQASAISREMAVDSEGSRERWLRAEGLKQGASS